MTCSYIILDSAREELDNIVRYLLSVADGNSVAKAFLDEFEKQLALVCDNPEIYGLSYLPRLAELGYRSFHVKHYIALYFYRDDRITVAHVFHQRQDYARFVTG